MPLRGKRSIRKTCLPTVLAFLTGMLFTYPRTQEIILDPEIETPDTTVVETVFLTEEGDTVPPESLQAAEAPIEKFPEVVSFTEAVYPPEELKQGIEGPVVFEFIVTDSGLVESARVVQGLTPAMDSSALAAVRRFRFSPAMAAGQPVPVIIQYEYRFAISEEVKKIDQYVNFSGVIREMGTRAPVADAMVVITYDEQGRDTSLAVPWDAYMEKIAGFDGQYREEQSLVSLTDEEGRFNFTSLPAGSITVSFPVTGYKPMVEKEAIEPGQLTEVTYRLERTRYDEYEIVVYGKEETKEVAKKTLNINEVKKIPGFGGDAVKVVQALPGVARASFISGEVIVRGSSAEDTRFFLDGVSIPEIYHFGGLRSTYNSDILGSIDLYPGGYNTRYGGALGGVVEIKGRPAKTDRWHGNVDINLLDASFTAEGPVRDDLTLTFTGRRSYIANMLDFAVTNFQSIDLPMTVVPYYWDWVTRADYRPTKNDRMFLTFFASQDKMKFVVDEVRGGSTDISEARDALSENMRFQQLIFGYDKQFNDRTANELRISYGREKLDFGIFGFVTADFYAPSYILRDELTHKVNDKLTLRGGLDLDLTDMDYTLLILGNDGVSRSEVSNWFTIEGFYANLEYQPFENLMIMPGLRYDYFAELDAGKPSYRLTTSYQLPGKQKIKAAAGTYTQGPTPEGQAIDPEWGNPDLPVCEATQYVLGYQKDITDLVNVEAQVYYNTQDKLATTTGTWNPVTGEPYNYLPDMDARMYGLEIMLRHNQGRRFFGWISYSLSRSERKTKENPSFTAYEDWKASDWYLYGKDQTHNLQLVGSWKLPLNFEFGSRVRYVTGDPTTPLLGYTENTYEYDADYHGYDDLPGEYLSDRMGPFFQVDLRVDKKFIYKDWIFSAYLDVQNTNYFLYNSPETYDYNYDASERQSIGGIILPSLGLRAEF